MVLIGILGTILVNLLRVTIVCLLAATVGRWPAVIFHDYAGTLMIIAWLFAFWSAAQRWFLVDRFGPGDQLALTAIEIDLRIPAEVAARLLDVADVVLLVAFAPLRD